MRMEKLTLDGIGFGTKTCQCTSCSRLFTTVANFDRHRKGGECLYPELTKPPMALNSRGIWRVKSDREWPEKIAQ